MDGVQEESLIFLTGKFEFPTAGVAVVLGAEVPDGVVSQVGRSKDHVVGSVGVTETPQESKH